MNPIVERDIAHVGRVMRASVLLCAPQMVLVDYWRRRVMSLLNEDDIAEFQLHSLRGLLRELDEIEETLDELRGERLRNARPLRQAVAVD